MSKSKRRKKSPNGYDNQNSKNPRKRRKRQILWKCLKKTGKLGFKVGRKVTKICLITSGVCLITMPIIETISECFPVLDRCVPIPQFLGNNLNRWVVYTPGSVYSQIVAIGPATLSKAPKFIKVISVLDKSVLENRTCLSAIFDPAIQKKFHNRWIYTMESAYELYNRWIYTAGSAYDGARLCKTVPILIGQRPRPAITSWVPKPVPETIIDQWKDMSIFKIRTTTGVLRDPVNLMTHILPFPESINFRFYKVTNEEWYVLLSEAFFPFLNHGRILYAECFELMRRYHPVIECTILLFIEDCKILSKGWIPIIKGLVLNPFRDLRIFKTEIKTLIRQWDMTVTAYTEIGRNQYRLLSRLTYKLWYVYWVFGTRTIDFSIEFFPIVKDHIICVGSYIWNLSSDLYPVILRTGHTFVKDCHHFNTKIRPLIPVEYPMLYSLEVLVNSIIDNRRRLNLNITNRLKLGVKKILTLNIREILAFDIHDMLTVSHRNIILPFNFRKLFMKILGRVLGVKLQKQLFDILPLILHSETDKFMFHYFDLELGEEPTELTSLSTLFKESTLVLSVTHLFARLSKDIKLFMETKRSKFQKILAVAFSAEVNVRLVGLTEEVLKRCLALYISKLEGVMLFRFTGQALEQAWAKKFANELERALDTCFLMSKQPSGQLEKILTVCFPKQGLSVLFTYKLEILQRSLEMGLAGCLSKDVERKRFVALEKKLEATLAKIGSPTYQKSLENPDLVHKYILSLCWFEKYFVKNYEGNQYQILNRYMNLLALNYLNYENVRQPLKDQKYYYEKLEKFYKEWHSVPGKKDFKRFKKLAVICMILHLEMTK